MGWWDIVFLRKHSFQFIFQKYFISIHVLHLSLKFPPFSCPAYFTIFSSKFTRVGSENLKHINFFFGLIYICDRFCFESDALNVMYITGISCFLQFLSGRGGRLFYLIWKSSGGALIRAGVHIRVNTVLIAFLDIFYGHVHRMAYKGLVRSVLEYGSSVVKASILLQDDL